ncbi:bifunctional alpha/beta hydrolase/OsmC family protein [Hyphobacterium sp. HN65]|uniref:Bifunctional alpha/beta hydrolase/OsmC family protein n=1 Tax=Hyphobacterium lacteum TaxID=3116575 RepID=A0ABU7LT47_9PROT|nr:bifunctional alpha/beta hydrolase/OsmC family protein [Hyphobacterium sp. HN65]MEE2527068.1 bifunctional alpha/beta hydrolase/OsmC family protein [Hyphobacterium sp. HN65]
MPQSQKVEFSGAMGDILSAKLELPAGNPRGYALFAHCFSCSKDFHAASRIARRLAEHGIAVLRFDFTGLGDSDGDFANTNFSSNIDDLVKAAEFLESSYESPVILIGHSLGGAAVIAAAHRISSVRAVVTIGAPADAEHVTRQFSAQVSEIEQKGEATVSLGGRSFRVTRQFLDDIAGHSLEDAADKLKRPLLICHSPVDEIVGIDNASRLFVAAKHPKSFISLDNADHLLSNAGDAHHVADIVSAWADKYAAPDPRPAPPKPVPHGIVVQETRLGKFQTWVVDQDHVMMADEPVYFGGDNTGMNPYGFLSASLGACTSMTIRMYADHKKMKLDRVTVSVLHKKIHVEDCHSCKEGEDAQIDMFWKEVRLEGNLSDSDRQRLMEIADRCPVHRTLNGEIRVETQLVD